MSGAVLLRAECGHLSCECLCYLNGAQRGLLPQSQVFPFSALIRACKFHILSFEVVLEYRDVALLFPCEIPPLAIACLASCPMRVRPLGLLPLVLACNLLVFF